MTTTPAPAPDDEDRQVVFEDTFDGTELSPERWIPHYLPHWTTPERSPARYAIADGVLELRIEADQPPWSEGEGELRTSSVQTASFAGPVGSDRGTHPHHASVRVETPVATQILFAPSEGRVECHLRTAADPGTMAAVWLVGVGLGSPQDAGEICIAELYAEAVGPSGSRLTMGLKAHGDPRLHDDMAEVLLDIDAGDWHTYGAEWTADSISLFVDGDVIRTIPQGMDYPQQLMIDIFEFPQPGPRDPAAYPKTVQVDWVRGSVRAGRAGRLAP